jgi:predicted RNase H-like HicB family nuclease
MALPYSKVVTFYDDESGQYFVSEVLELSGCSSTGDTETEALECLKEAMEGYLQTKLDYGDPIPEPVKTEEFNGKFLLRLPKTLHRKLSYESKKEGVSLNQYALYKLSQ